MEEVTGSLYQRPFTHSAFGAVSADSVYSM